MREDSRAVIHWQHPDKQDGKGKHGGKAAIGDGGHRCRAMFEGDALTTLVDEAEEEGNGGRSSGGRGGSGGIRTYRALYRRDHTALHGRASQGQNVVREHTACRRV